MAAGGDVNCRFVGPRAGSKKQVVSRLHGPKFIRFQELTKNEYLCTEDGANSGVMALRKHFENTSETEPLVTLHYFGPGVKRDTLGDGRVSEEQASVS